MKYVDVAPAVPLPSHKDTFTYSVGKDIELGAIVSVPFGHRNVRGVVVGRVAKKPPYRTKKIPTIHEASLTPEQLAFGAKLTGVLGGGLGFTLRLFFPPSLRTVTSSAKKKKPQRAGKDVVIIAPRAKRIKTLQKDITEHVQAGRQVLLLVPERWMVERFPWATAFHAGLKASEIAPIWEEVSSGVPMCIVGTQKALFLPWRNLVCIAIDEEYMQTHKLWDGYPRGDNRRLADIAGSVYGATLVRSGSFPSLATYLKRKNGEVVEKEWSVFTPKYNIVEVTFEDRRYKRPVPNELVHLIRTWKRKKKKVFILHNETESNVAKALQGLRLLKSDQIVIGTSAKFAQLRDEVFDYAVWMFPERTFSFPDVQSSEYGYVMIARLQSLLRTRARAVTLVSRHKEFIERVCAGSLTDVYGRLLQERKKYLYPPYTDMVKLMYKGRSVKVAVTRAEGARALLSKRLVAKRDTVRVLGPYEELKKKGARVKPERFILLLGPLDVLQQVYPATLPDTVDIDPKQVLTN